MEIIRIELFRDLDPEEIARITGGTSVKKDGIPWEINYKEGRIVFDRLAGRTGTTDFTPPFLDLETLGCGPTLIEHLAVFTQKSMTLIYPKGDQRNREVITLSRGTIIPSKFDIQIPGLALVLTLNALHQ